MIIWAASIFSVVAKLWYGSFVCCDWHAAQNGNSSTHFNFVNIIKWWPNYSVFIYSARSSTTNTRTRKLGPERNGERKREGDSGSTTNCTQTRNELRKIGSLKSNCFKLRRTEKKNIWILFFIFFIFSFVREFAMHAVATKQQVGYMCVKTGRSTEWCRVLLCAHILFISLQTSFACGEVKVQMLCRMRCGALYALCSYFT